MVIIIQFEILFISLIYCQKSFGVFIHNNDSRVIEQPWSTLSGLPTKIFGHRGEKFLMPEHTLASYEIACIENSDSVEPDLVLTKDEHLVCFHDLTLSNRTNVQSIPELAPLQGLTVPGDWYIPDFTLAQVKMVRVRQSQVGVRPQYFNDFFPITTFEEFLQLVHTMELKLNRTISIIPELKSPEIVNARLGQPHLMENKVLQVLRNNGYPLKNTDTSNCRAGNISVPCPPVILQCYNKEALRYLGEQTDIELMMLVEDDPSLMTIAALAELKTFIDHYGIWKEVLYSGAQAALNHTGIRYNSTEIAAAGGFIPTATFTNLVHASGMAISIYTIYDSREPSGRGCAVRCAPENKTYELYHYFGLGVDSMFVENIPEAMQLRLEYGHDQEILRLGNGQSHAHGSALMFIALMLVAFNTVT